VSPEVCVSKDSVLPSISNSNLDRLYDVATFNNQVKKDVLGKTTRWLGYKQNRIEVVWSDDKQEAD